MKGEVRGRAMVANFTLHVDRRSRRPAIEKIAYKTLFHRNTPRRLPPPWEPLFFAPTAEWNLIVGCDLPYLTPEWIAWLISRALESRAKALVPEFRRFLRVATVFQSVPVTSMSNGFRWSGASSFYRDCALVLSGLAIR